jgi:hypothetical protein
MIGPADSWNVDENFTFGISSVRESVGLNPVWVVVVGVRIDCLAIVPDAPE